MATWEELRKREAEERLRKRYGLRADDVTEVEEAARRRRAEHMGKASSRPLSEGFEVVGVAGELAASRFLGVPMPDRPPGARLKKPANLIVGQHYVNVLTARTPTYLIVEKGKVRSDVYILAQFREETTDARLLGWATKDEVQKAPVQDIGGHGIRSHAIHRRDLRPISTLRAYLGLDEVQQALI